MKRRRTVAQTAVMKSLEEARVALSHDQLVGKLAGTADRATIYRILNRFREDGIVHRIVADDGKQYFALCSDCNDGGHNHDHFHFRCRSCNRVECLSSEISVVLPSGYQAEGYNGVIAGVCPQCSEIA